MEVFISFPKDQFRQEAVQGLEGEALTKKVVHGTFSLAAKSGNLTPRKAGHIMGCAG